MIAKPPLLALYESDTSGVSISTCPGTGPFPRRYSSGVIAANPLKSRQKCAWSVYHAACATSVSVGRRGIRWSARTNRCIFT